jgi:DNA repair protein RadC
LAHFSSLDQLREAPLEALAAVPGVGPAAAARVKAFIEAQRAGSAQLPSEEA